MVAIESKSGAGFDAGQAAARLIGSTASGVMELAIFHPVDTVAKRLMTNKNNV
jgi:hypothetical protein